MFEPRDLGCYETMSKADVLTLSLLAFAVGLVFGWIIGAMK